LGVAVGTRPGGGKKGRLYSVLRQLGEQRPSDVGARKLGAITMAPLHTLRQRPTGAVNESCGGSPGGYHPEARVDQRLCVIVLQATATAGRGPGGQVYSPDRRRVQPPPCIPSLALGSCPQRPFTPPNAKHIGCVPPNEDKASVPRTKNLSTQIMTKGGRW